MVSPDGAARVVAEDLMFPNGSVITPDGRTLIVAESFGRKLTAFEIAEDGSLSSRRVFAEFQTATPDGICLDEGQGIWIASPTTGEFLRVVEGGTVTDQIDLPGKWAVACMLGGEDQRTLFLLTATGTREDLVRGTAEGYIETVRVERPGAGLP